MFTLFYSSIVQANPTDELEERFQQMTLPEPSLPGASDLYSDHILYYYPHIIDYLQSSVRSVWTVPLIWLTLNQGIQNQKCALSSPSRAL